MNRADRIVAEQLHALTRGKAGQLIVRTETTAAAAGADSALAALADGLPDAVPLAIPNGPPVFMLDLSGFDGPDALP